MHMQKKFVILMAVAVLSTGLLVVGCSKPSSEATSPTGAHQAAQAASPLRITINSWIGWAPLYLAKERGLFGALDVEIIRVEDTGARKATMISGEVDGYASSVDNFALDSAQGVPGKIVMCFDESYGGDGIVPKKAITSVQDLKGHQVGYQKGLPSHFLLLTVLKQAGLSPNDVVQVDMDADKAGAAFVAGHLDAAVTWEPWISKAAETADGKILVTTRDFPGLIVDTLVFRDDVLAKRRADVETVVGGWFKALAEWDAHKDEADAIMAKAYGLNVDDFRGMCSGVRFYDLEKNRSYFGTGASGEIYRVFQSAADLWFVAGVITQKTDPVARIDSSFLPK